MLGLINSCCGGDQSIDEFEKARIVWTAPDWDVPPRQTLALLISGLRGEQPSLNPEQAINDLLAHLEQGDQRKNAAYVLKHLVLLDLIVEQRLFLNRIGHYYNSQLIYMECIAEKKTNTYVKDLIASYYVYIKEKAKYYELQDDTLILQEERKKKLAATNSIGILNEINTCFRVQNLILDVNDKFKSGNKAAPLIQFIFELMLKTYLYCHSIVMIGLQTFIKRIPELSNYDLQYLKKLATYYHKDYSRNLMSFLSLNKCIPIFKIVADEGIILSDHDKISMLIKAQFSFLQHDPGICPDPQELPLLQHAQLVVGKPEDLNNLDAGVETAGSQKEGKQRHKIIETQVLKQLECFKNYQNCFSDNFSIGKAGVKSNQDTQPLMTSAQIFNYYKNQLQSSPAKQQSKQV